MGLRAVRRARARGHARVDDRLQRAPVGARRARRVQGRVRQRHAGPEGERRVRRGRAMSDYERVYNAWVEGEGVRERSSELLEECVSIAHMKLDTPHYANDRELAPRLRMFANQCLLELERRAIVFLRAPSEDESIDEYLVANGVA